MRKPLLLALVLLVSGAAAARAQNMYPGLNLFWDHCYSGGGTIAKTFACDTNVGPWFEMFASVVLPADMPRFAAASVIVDVTIAGGTQPPWWQTAAGQCRANAIAVTFDWPSLEPSGCMNIWMNTPVLSVLQIQQPVPGGVATFRINAGAAVPAGSEIAWVADGTELVVARIAISRAKTVGTNACEGCATTACFFYRESRLQQPAGVGDYWITNWATTAYTHFLGGAGVTGDNWNICEVPALNRTWGAIKVLYR